jgi:hypothetical protein
MRVKFTAEQRNKTRQKFSHSNGNPADAADTLLHIHCRIWLLMLSDKDTSEAGFS